MLQSTTPALFRTTPVLLEYYSVLQSSISYYKVLFQYYKALLCTTKYYSNYKVLFLYYKVLLQYYSVLLQQQHQQQQRQHKRLLAILLQFRAIDAHDSTKGLLAQMKNREITTISRDRHARSYDWNAPRTGKFQFLYSFARSTRTILRKGSTQHRKIAISLKFRVIDTYDLTKGLLR